MKSVFMDGNGDLWIVPDETFDGERSLFCPQSKLRCGRQCAVFDEDTDDTGHDIAVCGISNRPIGFLKIGYQAEEKKS